MRTHLEMEIDGIKAKIFEMADLAIESITLSVDSLKNGDSDLARKVIENDSVLDRIEMELDDECVKLLVTRQPAAADMRFILSVLKINTDLERIGDIATNIAREAIACAGKPLIKPLIDIPRMTSICIEMLKDAFQSITDRSVSSAMEVIERDEEIDRLNLQVYRELFSYMAENPRTLSQGLGLIMVAKGLERIGDHATNIAERAIYFIKGEDVRHSDE